MADPKVVLARCKAAAADLDKRLTKYRQALDALSREGEITEAKVRKRNVKLDDAWKKAHAAEKEMRNFLNGQFKNDYASATDDGKKLMDKWKKDVEKLLAAISKMMHISNLLVPAEALFE